MKRMALLSWTVASLIILSFTSVTGQETSVEGDWWISMRGNDKGAASLNFANLVGGVVDVTGVGMTMGTG